MNWTRFDTLRLRPPLVRVRIIWFLFVSCSQEVNISQFPRCYSYYQSQFPCIVFSVIFVITPQLPLLLTTSALIPAVVFTYASSGNVLYLKHLNQATEMTLFQSLLPANFVSCYQIFPRHKWKIDRQCLDTSSLSSVIWNVHQIFSPENLDLLLFCE